MIVLDTCAVLWLAAGSPRLSDEVRRRIDAEPVVAISSISAFEIALKYRDGKLALPFPPREWWKRVLDHHRLDLLQLEPEILFTAVSLPPVHRDPADRFIIATAIIHDASVVTADSRFSDYGVTILS
ncbi:MAG: type II toxin-antitoxin system VapC family toxin [Alkalispirochaeta sp.]